MTDTVLIVDDEPDIRELVEITLSRMGLQTSSAATLTEARSQLAEQTFGLCLTDMQLPDGNGITLVEHIQQHYPQLPAAVITAHGNMDAAIQAMKAGAFDFVNKPVDINVLRRLTQSALKAGNAPPPSSSQPLLGDSAAMQKVRATIAKVARSHAPVFISGASGTGKERVARNIHEQSARANGPFIPVNCGAIPSELMESEFFGHLKGSFTGASADQQGLFQAADGGTLFLDEVADLPLSMQVKLLRAIQEKAVRPVGGHKEQGVDIRLLSATHRNLAELVATGEFRQDLYYRINVIDIIVPPLTQRLDDLPLLVEHIMARLQASHSESTEYQLSEQAWDALEQYHFPGNIRELENILERAITLADSPHIQAADLGLEALNDYSVNPTADHLAANHQAAIAETDSNQPADDTAAAQADSFNLESHLDNIEKDAILTALKKASNNKTAAAKQLGISFRALRYRLKKLGLDQIQ